MIVVGDPTRIGPVLAQLRVMGRLTQRQLADASGLPQGRMSEWETGKILPTLPSLVRFLGTLGWQLALIPAEDDE